METNQYIVTMVTAENQYVLQMSQTYAAYLDITVNYIKEDLSFQLQNHLQEEYGFQPTESFLQINPITRFNQMVCWLSIQLASPIRIYYTAQEYPISSILDTEIFTAKAMPITLN